MARLARRPLPSAERVRELFSYDAETGHLSWKIRQGSACPGDRAGTRCTGGYRRASVDKVYYLEHRLIWLVVTGEEPWMIDHVDGDGENNSWINLRKANSAQNRTNTDKNRNNTSGFKGVHWCALHKKWRAVVKSGPKIHHVGYFNTPERASEARQPVADRLHGKFARAA